MACEVFECRARGVLGVGYVQCIYDAVRVLGLGPPGSAAWGRSGGARARGRLEAPARAGSHLRMSAGARARTAAVTDSVARA
jgi:hypothetical protein